MLFVWRIESAELPSHGAHRRLLPLLRHLSQVSAGERYEVNDGRRRWRGSEDWEDPNVKAINRLANADVGVGADSLHDRHIATASCSVSQQNHSIPAWQRMQKQDVNLFGGVQEGCTSKVLTLPSGQT